MTVQQRTMVLIHGCHLQAREWEHVVFGDYKNGIYGRVPTGLQIADRHAAIVVYWGTGASKSTDGLFESEYTFTAALAAAHINQGYPGELYLTVADRSIIDVVSQNTTEEIAAAAAACQIHNIERLILVSSPTHIARCHQEALKLKAAGGLSGIEVLAVASDTCFANSTAADVVIVEPPHRGDLPNIAVHQTVRKIFALMRSEQVMRGFLAELEQLISKWRALLS